MVIYPQGTGGETLRKQSKKIDKFLAILLVLLIISPFLVLLMTGRAQGG
jgi:hypothetical protein